MVRMEASNKMMWIPYNVDKTNLNLYFTMWIRYWTDETHLHTYLVKMLVKKFKLLI